MGFGDGRYFPLLNNLGFKISGVEISDSIIQLAKDKFANLGIKTDLRLGRNSSIPFKNQEFDYLLACHAIYYVDHNETFNENLTEVARVLKPGGVCIASLPKSTGTIIQNSCEVGGGRVEITSDPLAPRNGSIFRVFESKAEIQSTFSTYFDDFVIGGCDDEYFGIQQNVWTIICKRNQRPVG